VFCYTWLFRMVQVDVPVVLFGIGLSGILGLFNMDLTTLTEDAVCAHYSNLDHPS
jgi:hypothetical protein